MDGCHVSRVADSKNNQKICLDQQTKDMFSEIC